MVIVELGLSTVEGQQTLLPTATVLGLWATRERGATDGGDLGLVEQGYEVLSEGAPRGAIAALRGTASSPALLGGAGGTAAFRDALPTPASAGVPWRSWH